MTSRERFEAWWEQEKYDDKLNCITGIMFNRIKANMFLSWQASEEAMAVQLANAESKCRELAADNAVLKDICNDRLTFIMNGVQLGYIKVPTVETDPALETIRVAVSPQEPTPATDAFLAEVRAQAHKEGAHFVANRMLAAWEAGFIEDTAKNAADIARMILTSTEFMADAPEGDFDRSFADGALKDIAAQLRKGAAL